MSRSPAPALLLALGAFALAAQSHEPRFTAADVRSRPGDAIPAMRSGFFRGRYELRNATMLDMVRTAWDLDPERILGGPDWLDTDRFDVIALAPADSAPKTLHAMLRAFLEDRFHLSAHTETGDLPVYALTASPKLLLHRSAGTGEGTCSFQQFTDRPAIIMTCQDATMSTLAARLSGAPGSYGYLFNYRVADRTALAGSWDAELTWTARPTRNGRWPTGEITTLNTALDKQLGLKLAPSTEPGTVLRIEHVQHQASPAPHSEIGFERAPERFEVASIKFAGIDDGLRNSGVRVQPGGRVTIDMTLRGLIQEAWYDLNPERILGGPRFLDTARYQIVAELPGPQYAAGPAVFNGTDIDSMRRALRSLLVDRFGLAAHEETRPVPGYALVAARPKLKTAASGNRPACKEGPGDDGVDPRLTNPMAVRLVTCRNVTMSRFAAELGTFGSAYLHQFPPIADSTHLSGSYDATLNFSVPAALKTTPSPESTTADPNGAISLFEALRGQLGLRLEKRQTPGTVLVIDGMNEKPSEN